MKHIIQQSAPAEFIHTARNPSRSVPVGGRHTAMVPVYGPPFVRDLERGRRYGTIEDFCNFVNSPMSVRSSIIPAAPFANPATSRSTNVIWTWYTRTCAGRTNHSWAQSPRLNAPKSPSKCAAFLFGAETLETNCVILGNVNVNSPLVYDGTVTRVMRTYAAAGRRVVSPFILGRRHGSGHAGRLHRASPCRSDGRRGVDATGAPRCRRHLRKFLHHHVVAFGAPTFGQPEAMLAYMVVGQLCRRLGVPLRCGGALTSAKTGDAQSAQESAQSLLPALLSGANFILQPPAGLEGGLVSGYEKFIQDADRCGMMAKMFEGLALDSNAFAMDAYREIEHGQHFLGTAHTLSNYTTAFYESNIANNVSYEQWLEEGELNDEQRACAIWKQQLRDYQAPPMDPSNR